MLVPLKYFSSLSTPIRYLKETSKPRLPTQNAAQCQLDSGSYGNYPISELDRSRRPLILAPASHVRAVAFGTLGALDGRTRFLVLVLGHWCYHICIMPPPRLFPSAGLIFSLVGANPVSNPSESPLLFWPLEF